MRNDPQSLYVSPKYSAAALELMIREANWFCEQLQINENVQLRDAPSEDWSVCDPSAGIGGVVNSENYSFNFLQGSLRSIRKRDWLKTVSPPARIWSDFIGRPSFLDTSSAHSLSQIWLDRLGVNLQEFESAFPARVAQARVPREDSPDTTKRSERFPVPFFILTWGPPPNVLALQILGTTKELIGFEINDPTVFRRPLLKLEHSLELLQPIPPLRHFLEQRLGTPVVEIIKLSNRLQAWLLTSNDDSNKTKRERSGPKVLSDEQGKAFKDVLLHTASYDWHTRKLCIPDYGASLLFDHDGQTVEVQICYDCDLLGVTHAGETKVHDLVGDAHNPLVHAIQAVFPEDKVIRNLPLKKMNKN
jgi:hypothetical protein